MNHNTYNPGVYPLGARVLVKPDEEVETKEGVIFIPDTVKARYRDAQTVGTVVSVGPTAFMFEEKTYNAPTRMSVTPGRRVMFAKYGGIVIKGIDGLDYRMIWDDDILAEADVDFKLEIK